MRNGPVIVILLIVAAAFGAFLGPAGERVDPSVGPTEAFFKYVLKQHGLETPGAIYLSVAGQDPPAQLMVRFAGSIHPASQRAQATAAPCSIDLARLDWLGSDDHVRCLGTLRYKTSVSTYQPEFVLSPRGKWELRSQSGQQDVQRKS